MNNTRFLSILFSLIVTSSAVPASLLKGDAQVTNEEEYDIIGAKRARIQKYPYTVSTYSRVSGSVTGSGAVLNQNWILATTSQLYGMDETDIIIRGGCNDSLSGGQWTNVTKVITNFTDYDDVDIALLKTATRLKFDAKLKPIKLANFIPKLSSKAVLSGFGSGQAVNRGVLTAAPFKIVSFQRCKDIYESEAVFCADSAKYEPAYDDLGAPLVQRAKLVGVYIGCYMLEPFVFTRIANARSWILENIKKNSIGDEAEGIDFGVDDNENDDDLDDEEEEDDDDDDDDSEDDGSDDNAST